jgi:hypothetical protein
MGEVYVRIAGRFLLETGLNPPFSAEVAAHEAGLLLCPSKGSANLTETIVRYDESRSGWERELWAIVCGVLLRRAGERDTLAGRAALVRALGRPLQRRDGRRREHAVHVEAAERSG